LIETSFKGQHEASSISAQVYRVPGYAWKQDFPCDCDIKNLRVVKDGKDAPQVEYVPEEKQDRIKFKFKIEAEITTGPGEGKVTLTTSEEVELWLFKGTIEDRDKYHKLRNEGVAAYKAAREAEAKKKGEEAKKKDEEAKKKHKEADDLWKKLKPEPIKIKQEEMEKKEPQELECNNKYDWSYEPEGEFFWEAEDYRIGTADKPQTRGFWLVIYVTIKCGKTTHSVSFYWSANVGWEKGKVKKSNEKIDIYAF
jgi:hypothetical protein